MASIDSELLIRIIAETYNTPFDLLMEAAVGEHRQWVTLSDWETNGTKWGVAEDGHPVGSRDFTIDAGDLERTAVGGSSISKSQYLFLPMTFAMTPHEGQEAFMRIMAAIKEKGSVTVSTWPGYGVDEDGAYPALVVGKLPAETRSMIEDQLGRGGVIYAVDGVPLSQFMVKGVALPGEEGSSESERFKRWMGGDETRGGNGGPAPVWLTKLSGDIDAAIRNGTIKAEISRIKKFEGELILSTPQGDAVMLVSKQYAKAAYILRKKMDINGAPTDYDVAVSGKMNEFSASFKRKPRGQKLDLDVDLGDLDALKRKAKGALDREGDQPAHKRPPRLMLRDWLKETDNGYALRRDVRIEDIRALLASGLNFEDGRVFAETSPQAESTFSVELDRVLSENTITESMDTVQSFLDVVQSPWSMDEHRLFEYLNTLAPEELDDWVSALEICVENGEGDRWVHSLLERSQRELRLTQSGKARVQGILIDLQAPPVETPHDTPPEEA